MSQVHYWELSNYNGGVLIGKWFELTGKTYVEHSQEITAWMEALTKSTGELCEEWILGDVDGVPVQFYGEWSICESFFDYMEALENTTLDVEAFEAGMELGIDLDRIEESYHGEYKDDTDLAYEYVDSTGLLSEVPENIKNYFDYESFGRDLSMDFSEHNGHYFNNNW